MRIQIVKDLEFRRDNSMSFSDKKTPITAKQVSAILGVKEKTIHNRGGGTSKLSRMHNGRSVRFILQEVEALRDKRLKDGQRRSSTL
jgi:predicted DNA-binding transcriptional regulator AlpA